MWVLIVVTIFYQRDYQPEVTMHDFTTQAECTYAANMTSDLLKQVLHQSNRDENASGNPTFRVQCVRK
jgi:hypothetical protein